MCLSSIAYGVKHRVCDAVDGFRSLYSLSLFLSLSLSLSITLISKLFKVQRVANVGDLR